MSNGGMKNGRKDAPHLKPEKPCFKCKKRESCALYLYPWCSMTCYPLADWMRAVRKRGVRI